ncbi:hypothetical protein L873DRAFT_1828884 [Choiromyces venosus 120613-1]|uniref:rhamnogalacturonan endolyase n=1 Tax=Choiromyces venosus 120613-1 TaxID=1336337 RepID=A0A3N4JV82_9PEZI|nr:hypothetical protein L873DRAFT_1828884 [Choiromyces venosus 120613-1]
MLRPRATLLVAAYASTAVVAQFGVTASTSTYRVNTNGGLIFDVSRTTGDIASLIYQGIDHQSKEGKISHINSGLGTSTVSAATYGTNYIKITVVSSGNPVTQYYGSDVFLVNGWTRCKYYSSEGFIDDLVISLVMLGNAYETSSGGPFMRDISNQETSTQQELTFYMNSGHPRTEPWRMGLKGPYAMVFSSNGFPSGNLDTSFFSELSILGYVPQSGPSTRGFETVISWPNTENQYWVRASGGSFTSPYMKSGTYTMKLYKQEFLVKTQTVTVTQGQTTTSNISSGQTNQAVLFRVGEFDRLPFEFKIGDKFLRMHPSDTRMSTWGGSITIGSQTASSFPMALFAKAGGTGTIGFTLASTQTGATTLRVGTALSFKTGRPSPSINGAWTGADPGAPVLIDSRGVTRGGYRGYGEVYTWTVPPGVLKAGANTLTLRVYGGGDAGCLSANYILDEVELWAQS